MKKNMYCFALCTLINWRHLKKIVSKMASLSSTPENMMRTYFESKYFIVLFWNDNDNISFVKTTKFKSIFVKLLEYRKRFRILGLRMMSIHRPKKGA